MSAAYGGDIEAQRRLMLLLQPVLFRVARQLLATRRVALDAGDLAQEAWLALYARDWHALRAYDPTLSSLQHFVAIAARHAMQAVLRRRGRSGSHEQAMLPELDTPGADEEKRYVARDELGKVLGALRNRVPVQTWTCFERCTLDGTPISQLVLELGSTRASIDVRLCRARAEARAVRRSLDI